MRPATRRRAARRRDDVDRNDAAGDAGEPGVAGGGGAGVAAAAVGGGGVGRRAAQLAEPRLEGVCGVEVRHPALARRLADRRLDGRRRALERGLVVALREQRGAGGVTQRLPAAQLRAPRRARVELALYLQVSLGEEVGRRLGQPHRLRDARRVEDEFGGVEAEDATVRAGPRVRLVGVDLDPVVADAGGAPRVRLVRRPRVAVAHVQVGVAGERLEVDAEDEAVVYLHDRVPVLVAADVGADGDAGRQLGRLELVGEERDGRERGLDDGDRLARFEHEAVGAEARVVLGRAERRVGGGGDEPQPSTRVCRSRRARAAYLGSVRCSAELYASAWRVAASTGATRASAGYSMYAIRAAGRSPTSQPARDARARAPRVVQHVSDSRSREKPRIRAAAAEEEEETSPPVPRDASHVSSGSGSGSSSSWKTTVGAMEGSETRVEAAVKGIFAPTVIEKAAPVTRVGSAAWLAATRRSARKRQENRAWKMQARAPPGASCGANAAAAAAATIAAAAAAAELPLLPPLPPHRCGANT